MNCRRGEDDCCLTSLKSQEEIMSFLHSVWQSVLMMSFSISKSVIKESFCLMQNKDIFLYLTFYHLHPIPFGCKWNSNLKILQKIHLHNISVFLGDDVELFFFKGCSPLSDVFTTRSHVLQSLLTRIKKNKKPKQNKPTPTFPMKWCVVIQIP